MIIIIVIVLLDGEQWNKLLKRKEACMHAYICRKRDIIIIIFSLYIFFSKGGNGMVAWCEHIVLSRPEKTQGKYKQQPSPFFFLLLNIMFLPTYLLLLF